MPKLNAYLTFNNNCQEAMNFYKECFGGELYLMPVGESPVASQLPPHLHTSILHSTLTTKDFEIMGTDMMPETLNNGNAMHMCLILKSEEETRILFDKLSAGGTINQPLHAMFFGIIGTLTDKFGKSWILECDNQ